MISANNLTSERKMVLGLFLSMILEIYAFSRIGSYQITLFMIITTLIIITCAVNTISSKVIQLTPCAVACLLFVLYILINMIIHGGKGFTSFLLVSFFVIGFMCTERIINSDEMKRIVDIFIGIINVSALYGIYQFISRNVIRLPLGDLWINGLMQEGYNWTNRVSIGGVSVYRSNSFFLEASGFSQFLAYSIILLFIQLREEEGKHSFFWIIVSSIAMILSFSGTGFIVLFFGAALFFLNRKYNKISSRHFYRMFVLFLFVIIIVIGFVNTGLGHSLVDFFERRVLEFRHVEGSSAYSRFVGGFTVIREEADRSIYNLIFGMGIGEAKNYHAVRSITMNQNGFFRIMIELGIVGMLLYSVLFIQLYKKCKWNIYQYAFLCATIPMIFCCESLTLHYMWIIMYIINCDVYDDYLGEMVDS